MATTISNLLTIDVEDYFHVSAFENVSPPSTWESYNSRVETNTDRILALLEKKDIKATFFVLGWVASRFPALVKRIAAAGHEVASHGYWHQRVCRQKRSEFREDIRWSKALLEDLVGQPVAGYRAPSYSISNETEWAFDELLEAGYGYDSSVFPVEHDFYGMPDWSRFSGYAVKAEDGRWTSADTVDTECRHIRELPISTVEIGGYNLPISGGGYFRLLPYSITRWGLKRINVQDQMPFVFYLHPWELDPQQPRMENISCKSKFRHYLNLSKTEKRFNDLLDDFEFTPISKGLCSLQ